MPTTADDRKRLALEFLDVLATRDVDAVLARMTDPPVGGRDLHPRPTRP